GISRADALRALLKRNTSMELKSFVSLLIQSDKLGTSISQSLKVYAETLRNKRKQKAEQLAAKASIKMTIPLILFILPATFIIILAPAAISIYKTFTENPIQI
ncbi:MAG: type II secretion system F family protein, partial [Candidatus Gastranaerophilales bacterium]|nr:type II secretion system F family protein [Candidatus Gastranaerophilales bacterium]